MARWFLLGCLIAGITATASAEEYLLRLESVGYIDQPETDSAPKETILRSLETLVEPNKPFRVKLQAGKETITFFGKLRPSPEENAKTDFEVEMMYEYRRELETGTTIVDPENRKIYKPAFRTRRVNTSLGIDVGQPVETSKLVSLRQKPPGQRVKSQFRCVLTLNKYDPIAAE